MENQHRCIQEIRIRALETGQAEMRVYVKDIHEDIQEIKSALKEMRPVMNGFNRDNNQLWQAIVMEVIKLAMFSISILGGIVGAVKILGK